MSKNLNRKNYDGYSDNNDYDEEAERNSKKITIRRRPIKDWTKAYNKFSDRIDDVDDFYED